MADIIFPITLSLAERDLLLNGTISIDDEILSKVEKAVTVGDVVRFILPLEELDLLLDGIAAEANHAENERKQGAFDRLHERLADFVESRLGDNDEGKMGIIPQVLDSLSPPTDLDDLDDASVIEMMNRAVDKAVRSYNRRPDKELGGLSPEQTYLLLDHGWWGSKAPLQLNSDLTLADLEKVRLLVNARDFLTAIAEMDGAPCTAKGNLNRKFTGEMLNSLNWPDGFVEKVKRFNKVINENDVWPLHLLRIIARQAGLIRKYKKKFVITKSGRSLLSEQKAGELFASLFNTHFRKFNLAYLDRLPEKPMFQAFFPILLYKLSQLSSSTYYEIEKLPSLMIPPTLLKEIESERSWCTPDSYLKMRVFRPLEKFGLLEIKLKVEKSFLYPEETHIKKTGLFDKYFRFSN